MGLDIFHAQAKREIDGNFFRVDDAASDQFKALKPYVQVHQNPHIDWEKMFSDQGLVFGNYRASGSATDGRYNCFVFVDADAVGFEAPIRVVFCDERRFAWLPKFMQRSRFRIPGSKKAPPVFGPFETTMKSEDVIFYDIVGYQRNGVSDEFYQCFQQFCHHLLLTWRANRSGHPRLRAIRSTKSWMLGTRPGMTKQRRS